MNNLTNRLWFGNIIMDSLLWLCNHTTTYFASRRGNTTDGGGDRQTDTVNSHGSGRVTITILFNIFIIEAIT